MNYAIVEIGGRQVWVEKDRYFLTNKLDLSPGTRIELKRVIVVNNEGEFALGQPYLPEVKVTGQVIEHLKGPKLRTFKMKSKKKYRRRAGHRQNLTKLRIIDISV